MTAIKDVNLSGSTIEYNGVQFGGADADQQFFPPEYTLSGSFAYDDAGRVVTHLNYAVNVRAILYHSSESSNSAQADTLYQKLNEPGKTLKLSGIGCGFSNDPKDIVSGPKPKVISLQPFGGEIAWEVVWQCEFGYRPSASLASPEPLTWMAFNFKNAWSNDFEGQSTRTISGYVQIAQRLQGDKKRRVAAEVRRKIVHLIPDGFRQTASSFDETLDKGRINFSFTVVQFNADPFPPGITNATGVYGMEATGAALVKGSASLGMTLTVAPGKSRKLGLQYFLKAAQQKQAHLRGAGGGSLASGGEQTVIPSSLRITHQLFSRTTSYSMAWVVTSGLSRLMTDGHIWEPVADTDFRKWKASVAHVWYNEGNAKLAAHPEEDIIIDLGDNKTTATIGRGPERKDANRAMTPLPPTITAPDEQGSFLIYDVWTEVYRNDNVNVHMLAATLKNEPSQNSSFDPLAKQPKGFGYSDYDQGSSEFHVAERSGFPIIRIVLFWRIMRIGFRPVFPELKTYGGKEVKFLRGNGIIPAMVTGKAGGFPVYWTTGYHVYQVMEGQPKRAEELPDPRGDVAQWNAQFWDENAAGGQDDFASMAAAGMELIRGGAAGAPDFSAELAAGAEAEFGEFIDINEPAGGSFF